MKKLLISTLAILAISGMAFGLTESQNFDDAAAAAAAGWVAYQGGVTAPSVFDAGVKATSLAGGTGGEGYYKSGTNDQLDPAQSLWTDTSYYADTTIGEIDVWTTDLTASGKFWLPGSGNAFSAGGSVWIGWFNSDVCRQGFDMEALGIWNYTGQSVGEVHAAATGGSITNNPPNPGWWANPDGSLNFNMMYGPADPMPAGPHTFEIVWDHDALPGYGGTVTVTIDGVRTGTANIQQGIFGFDGGTMDRFGMVFGYGNPTGSENLFAEAAIDDVSYTVVPEPATMSLLGLGGLLAIRRRK